MPSPYGQTADVEIRTTYRFVLRLICFRPLLQRFKHAHVTKCNIAYPLGYLLLLVQQVVVLLLLCGELLAESAQSPQKLQRVIFRIEIAFLRESLFERFELMCKGEDLDE